MGRVVLYAQEERALALRVLVATLKSARQEGHVPSVRAAARATLDVHTQLRDTGAVAWPARSVRGVDALAHRLISKSRGYG